MRFSIGSITFEMNIARNTLVRDLKEIYQEDSGMRVDTIREYRRITGASLKEAINFCNQNVFLDAHWVGAK